MEELKGKIISIKNFSQFRNSLKKLGDIVYYEGPFVSLFLCKKEHNKFYIYKWVNRDNVANRWLVYRVSSNDLVNYFRGKLSLLTILTKTKFVYTLDLGYEIEPILVKRVKIKDIPFDYFPMENSYYNEKFATEFGKKCAELNKEL